MQCNHDKIRSNRVYKIAPLLRVLLVHNIVKDVKKKLFIEQITLLS